MKKNRIYLIAALATAVFSLSSCIYDDEVSTYAPNGGYSDEELSISASMVESSAGTRAAYDLQGMALSAWTNAGIYVYKTTKTAVTDNYGFENQQVTSAAAYNNGGVTGQKLTISKSLFFPYDNGDVDVYVYAPHTAVTTGATSTTGVTATSVSNMAIQVQDDQTEDADYVKSDFIYGKAKAYYTSSPTGFVDKVAQVTMYHALTKVTFKIQDKTTTAALGTDASGITKIMLTGVYKKATIDMTQAVTATAAPWLTAGTHVTTADASTDPKGNVIVAEYDPTPSATTHTTNFYTTAKTNGVSAIIPPHDATQLASAKISVTIDGGTKTVDIYKTSSPAGANDLTELKPGYEYTFTLNIKGTELIIVAVTIKDWESGATVERDLEF